MATSKPKATILDLDALFDTKIDAVETLPDFVIPPAGLYKLLVKECKIESFETKGKEKASRIRITYGVEETVQINSEEQPVANNSLFSEAFMGTEDGLKFNGGAL